MEPVGSTLFPYSPYHFRWDCKQPKTKFERNGHLCGNCICYICNIVLTECGHTSHRWAVPPNSQIWVKARGNADNHLVLPGPLPMAAFTLPNHILIMQVLNLNIIMTDATCLLVFGVPSLFLQAYLQDRVGEFFWAGLRETISNWQIPLNSGLREFLNDICQSKTLQRLNKKWIGQMVRPTLLDPQKASHVVFYCPSRNQLQIDIYVQQHKTMFLQPMACEIMFGQYKKIKERPLSVAIPVLTRPLMPHQERSLERMVKMEKEGLTILLWDILAFTTADTCLYSNYILHAWHITQPTASFVAPDAICRGGLLCNERGTGKTYISVALMVTHKASAEWLATPDIAQTIQPPPVLQKIIPPPPKEEDSDEEEAPCQVPPLPESVESDESNSDEDAPRKKRKLPPCFTVPAPGPVVVPIPHSTETDYGLRLARWHAQPALRVPTTLVVVPGANLLTQWAEEIAFVGLRVKMFHGATKSLTAAQLQDVDVLLTTTDTLRANLTQGKTPVQEACQVTSVFAQVRFWRIIVDECHKLFQSSTLTTTGAALAWVRAHQRWGLTATPGTTVSQCRAYLQFLYGCPTHLTAAHNLVHHYVAYPHQYNGEAYKTVHQTQFFPAMTVQEQSAAGQLPTVEHHSHPIAAGGAWQAQYKQVILVMQGILKHGTYGPRIIHVLNSLLLCLTGAAPMPVPNPQDFQNEPPPTNTDLAEVPPDIIDCPICLEELAVPVRSSCQHYFCQLCIRQWLATGSRCPLCRTALREPFTLCQVLAPLPILSVTAAQQLPVMLFKMQAILHDVMLWATSDNTGLAEPLERFPNRLLIFSRFPQVRAILYAALQDAIRVSQDVKVFQNDPTIAVLILSPQSCGVGLNLMQANMVIFTEPAFKESTQLQAWGRAARMGQKRTVHVHQYFVSHTVEEHLLQQCKKNKVSLKDLFNNK